MAARKMEILNRKDSNFRVYKVRMSVSSTTSRLSLSTHPTRRLPSHLAPSSLLPPPRDSASTEDIRRKEAQEYSVLSRLHNPDRTKGTQTCTVCWWSANSRHWDEATWVHIVDTSLGGWNIDAWHLDIIHSFNLVEYSLDLFEKLSLLL